MKLTLLLSCQVFEIVHAQLIKNLMRTAIIKLHLLVWYYEQYLLIFIYKI
jgi:hypothetical protein